jgi:hypothetical protein
MSDRTHDSEERQVSNVAKKNGGQAAAPKPERQRPAFTVRIGRLSASVWANQHETQGTWYSITLTRSYKDGQGQWKTATSFGRDDLLVLGEMCRQVFHIIHWQKNGPKNGAGQQEEDQDASSANQGVDIPF